MRALHTSIASFHAMSASAHTSSPSADQDAFADGLRVLQSTSARASGSARDRPRSQGGSGWPAWMPFIEALDLDPTAPQEVLGISVPTLERLDTEPGLRDVKDLLTTLHETNAE